MTTNREELERLARKLASDVSVHPVNDGGWQVMLFGAPNPAVRTGAVRVDAGPRSEAAMLACLRVLAGEEHPVIARLKVLADEWEAKDIAAAYRDEYGRGEEHAYECAADELRAIIAEFEEGGA